MRSFSVGGNRIPAEFAVPGYMPFHVVSYFLHLLLGFVFWLPLAVLIIIIVFIVGNFEEIGRKLLFSLPENLFFPGMGIVLWLIIVYVSGILLKLTKIRSLFSKVPVLNLLFGAEEIITIEQLLHPTPCVFLYSSTCLYCSWILSEEKVTLPKEKTVFKLLNVYYPNVPAFITGQVFPHQERVRSQTGQFIKRNNRHSALFLPYPQISQICSLGRRNWGRDGKTDQVLRSKLPAETIEISWQRPARG